MDEYHATFPKGIPELCLKSPGTCPLGTGVQHFNESWQASEAVRLKLEEFQDWTSKSVVPQEAGYSTEYVFDPSRPDTLFDYNTLVGWGTDLADGTRLVIENGWVLEVEPGGGRIGAWAITDLSQSNEDRRFVDVGDFHDEVSLSTHVKTFGARLEVPEGTAPIRIKWVPEVGGY